MPENKDKDRQKIVVTLKDGRGDSIRLIAETLRKEGMTEISVLAPSFVFGKAAPEKLNQLKAIDGVADVEPDGEMGTE